MADYGLFKWQQRTFFTLITIVGLFNISTHFPWRFAFLQKILPAPTQLSKQQPLTLTSASAEAAQTKTAQLMPVGPASPLIYSAPARFQGQIVNQSQLPSQDKVIALTFDDGPWLETPKVLGILKQNNVKATFFMIGQHVETYPDIVKQVAAAGHAIGNHTWHHYTQYMDRAKAQAEIDSTSAAIFQLTGVKTLLFRPPAGRLDNGLVEYARNQKNVVVLWSADPLDWLESTSVQSLVKTALDNAKPGGIILLHDGGGNRSRTLQALPPIIAELKQRGYRFVTVPELLEKEDREIQATAQAEDKK